MATRVLVADDNPIILDLFRELVSSLEWDCHTVDNGLEALRMVEEAPPNLLVSDINMPGMNGLELVRSIRGTSQSSHIPIILMSSGALREEAMTAGCDAYLEKPFNVEEVLQLMRQLAGEAK